MSANPKAGAFLARIATRRALMGIVNVTPDSFTDGGRFASPETAAAQAARLVADGADIIDIGAESTRPGYVSISAEEEWRRLEHALPAVLAASDAPVSIDTQKADIAAKALAAGACVVNDIWGFQGDPRMAEVVAQAGAAAVLMHNRIARDPEIDIALDIHRFFERSLAVAARAGIAQDRIILDPGIGFGKTQAQNIAALKALPTFARHGCKLLIGVSRKSLFGALLDVAPHDRLVPTLAANLAAAIDGARVFRVHDVREHRLALSVFDLLER